MDRGGYRRLKDTDHFKFSSDLAGEHVGLLWITVTKKRVKKLFIISLCVEIPYIWQVKTESPLKI
jgi:hypothetical protein